jgi:hypothetical protein
VSVDDHAEETSASTGAAPPLRLAKRARGAAARRAARRKRSQFSTDRPDPDGRPVSDGAERAYRRAVSMAIYLSDERGHEAVEAALDDVAAAFDVEIVDRLPPILGSWFRKFKARTAKPETMRALQSRLAKLERATELQVLGRPQAEVDSAQADAVAKLLTALAGSPNALVQIGSVLLIKVDGVPVVRNLSHDELVYLERNPALFRDPAGALRELQNASRQIQEAVEASNVDRPAGLPSNTR